MTRTIHPLMDRNSAAPGAAREEGYTLTEIMVSIFIIGLLTSIAFVYVVPLMSKGSLQTARTQIAIFDEAMTLYYADMLSYPTTEQGLSALAERPDNLANPDRYPARPYMKNIPNDPWGNPYNYEFPGEHGEFDIYSFGADGLPGGEGDDADIGNWTEK